MQDGAFDPIDFDEFHRQTLPGRLARRDRVFASADGRVARPLAFALPDGRAYTYLPDGDSFSVAEGEGAADTVVALSEEDWCDFAWELQTSFALLYGDRLTCRRGAVGQLIRWEPALRAAFDGQPVYDLDEPPDLVPGDGRPLDLNRTFTLDDGDEEIAAFLHLAGFVHLRHVLAPDEVSALRHAVDEGVAAARPDDQRSWWTTVDGREVCHRVNYLNDRSPLVAGLGADPRFLRIGRLGGADLRDAKDRLDGNSVVIKVPGATAGLADLPWHRDCGMGGHPVKCPMLNVGIQLDAATAASGQLRMIAGSHRGISRLPGPREVEALPVATLTTAPGDVTVHYGHTLHAAPPPNEPTAAGRRALYLSFVPPQTFEMIGAGHGYNDVLFTRDAGRIRHVDQLG